LEKEKTEGEGASKHNPLEMLGNKKQRGEVLPNTTHLSCWRQNRGGRCSQTQPT
jgi:hypothetical protein